MTSPAIRLWAAALLGLCVVTAAPAAGRPDHLKLTAKEWREDLRFFAREMPKRHLNAFHHVTKEDFEAAVAALDARLETLDGDETYVGLMRIANSIGDGHTFVTFPDDVASFPLSVVHVGLEYRVIGVQPGGEGALGRQIVAIEGKPIAAVHDLIQPLTSQDENPGYGEAQIASHMTLGIVLRGLGITPDRRRAHFTLRDDQGAESTLELAALTPAEADARPTTWVFAKEPLRMERPGASFWYIWLPESRTVYCNFRGYAGLGRHGKELIGFIREKSPDKVIVDLRQNTGGDYFKGLDNIVHPLRDLPAINRKGHLFVMIGPSTFSAAMANATHFRYQTQAILAGMPIGEKPNGCGEPRSVDLPNSRLSMRYSTKLYTFVESGENVVRPDQEVVPTWDDMRAGRDPALEWVLAYK